MKRNLHNLSLIVFAAAAVLLYAGLFWLLWQFVPRAGVRYALLAVCAGLFLLAGGWVWWQRRQTIRFADELCDMLEDLTAGRRPEQAGSYDDTLATRVQDKLTQTYELLNEGRMQSRRDKQLLQELVSDISHQVKTPIANIRMFTGILQQHQLTAEKRAEFLTTLTEQIDKLDFLMQSLIKMSRLEAGTFAVKMKPAPLHPTIAQAMSAVWTKAEEKNIQLSAECDEALEADHDPKWTAEALGNILDNAVKYTPAGGIVTVTVRPWQVYTRIDIQDTGMGIPKEHHHDVFKRFYRAEAAAGQEGVGLGLYLANGIITRQKGYISVDSARDAGTTFSVYLLSVSWREE